MRKTSLYNTVRSLEDLIRDLRAKRDLARTDPKAEWTERDEEALAAAEKAVDPIKKVAGAFKRST